MTITLRSVKGSALTHGELDGNFTDLQNQLDNAAIAYDPVTITASTTLTAVDHANRLLICNSASPIVLTLQSDTLGGFAKDDSINAIQVGAGSVTIAQGTASALSNPTGTVATTSETFKLVGSVRIGANAHVLTESSGSGGGSSSSGTSETFALTQKRSLVAAGYTAIEVLASGIRLSNTLLLDSSTYASFTGAGALSYFRGVLFRTAAAAASRVSGLYNNSLYLRRDVLAPTNGGWPCTIVAGIGDASPTLGSAFIGLVDTSGATSNLALAPSSMVNMLGIGCDEGDTNWQLMHNDASGVATKVDLGANFVRSQNTPLCVTITKSADGSTCFVKVRNIVTDVTFSSAGLSTNLPVSTINNTPAAVRGTRTSSFTGDLLFGGFYLGAD